MNYSSARGSSIHVTVNLIMAAKPLDTIIGQPTTKSMDRTTEQTAQMVPSVKTTAWDGLHGSLALVLNDVDYTTVTRWAVTLTARLVQPPAVNPAIENNTPQRKLLRLQADKKNLQKAFDLHEAITNIGVQCIIDSVEEQYIKELNKDYFGYANQTTKSLLEHLCKNWCKVMTKERTNATKAFYHTWVPSSTHVIMFHWQMTKLQNKCCTINIIISDEAKTLHFVGQMYKSDYFTDDQMTKYKMQSNADKEWDPTLDHFSKLFAQFKAYDNDRTANSGLESAAAMFNVPSDCTFAMSKSNSNCTTHDLYIKSLKESLALAHDYVTNAPTPAPASTPIVDPLATLRLELDTQRKQFELLLKQNLDLVTAFAQMNTRPNPGSSATPKPRRTGCECLRTHLKEAPTARRWTPTSPMIVTPWQQTWTNAPLTIGHPRQPDRSWGPTLILI
jgi:hypothetical protein